MPARIVISEGGQLFTYDNVQHVPSEFDHLISFEPEIPEPPHTEEQHQEMSRHNDTLHELLSRQR